MKIFTNGSEKIDRGTFKAKRVKAKMAGCFEFRHKTVSFEYPAAIVPTPSSGFSKFGKMLRSRSDSDVSPSKKHSEDSPKLSPKGSPKANAPKRRFVRVIRGNNQSDQYFNPHVKRKASDPTQPKKRDLEALNRKYFSDSDSDSDTQMKRDRDFQRSRSEERSISPSIPIHGSLKKNFSLDVDMGRRARFKDQVDIIGFDKKGKQVYTAMERIHFDNFETCDIRNDSEQDTCLLVEAEVLDPISETPELAKSPPRLLHKPEMSKARENETEKNKEESIKSQEEIEDNSCEKENKDSKQVDESEHSSDSLKEDQESEGSGIRPRTSSLDTHNQKPHALRFIGRLFRSTSDSIMKISSPKNSPAASPDQLRKRHHRYVRVLRESDHGDEYHNPYVIRKSSSQEQSTSITGSVDNINERLRPILRKQHSLDLPTSSKQHADVHAHFKDLVEVVEFSKKTKCVNLIDEKYIQESHLKSDEENDSLDDSSDDVFPNPRISDISNSDPGVGSDDSFDESSTSKDEQENSIPSAVDKGLPVISERVTV